ncbi:MAG: DUF4388 domain-containing protein [Deltaproteobacteria bacterium]|nr:DUF4388 domain-containing protein [Deltaproteobacteria bacterium]
MSRFGDFTLLEDLGRSAVADRYKAVHAVQGGPFFLKAFTRLDARFHSELKERGDRLIGKTHNNLAPHLGHGVVGAVPFVVSPWLEGIDLVELSASLKDRRVNLTLDHCLIILVELSRSVAALHELAPTATGSHLAHGDVSIGHVRLGPDGQVWLTGLSTPRGLEPGRLPEARFDLAGVGALLYDLVPLLRGGAARPPLPTPLDRVIRRALGIGPVGEHLGPAEFADRLTEVGEALKLNPDRQAFVDVVRRTIRAVEKKITETGGRALIGGRPADAIPELIPVNPGSRPSTSSGAAPAAPAMPTLEPLKPFKPLPELVPLATPPAVFPAPAPLSAAPRPTFPSAPPGAPAAAPRPATMPMLPVAAVAAAMQQSSTTPPAPLPELGIAGLGLRGLEPVAKPTPRSTLFTDADETPASATRPTTTPPAPAVLGPPPGASPFAAAPVAAAPRPAFGAAAAPLTSPFGTPPSPFPPPSPSPSPAGLPAGFGEIPVSAPRPAGAPPATFGGAFAPLASGASSSTNGPAAVPPAVPPAAFDEPKIVPAFAAPPLSTPPPIESPFLKGDTDPDAARPVRIEAQKALPSVQALLKAGVVNAAQVEEAAIEQAQRGGRTLEILVSHGCLTDDDVALTLARSASRPMIAARDVVVADVGLLRRIPQTYALARRLLPLSVVNGTLLVAVADPFETKVIEEVKGLLHATDVDVRVAARKVLTEATLAVFGKLHGIDVAASGPRVLLCIQDEQKAQKLGDRLAQEGMQVEHVVDGHVAKPILSSRPPQAVICSHDLPGLDGRALLLHVRDQQSTLELPFFVLGPRSDDDLIARVLDLGADDFFAEPLRLDVVLAKLRRAIDKGKRHETVQPPKPPAPPPPPKKPAVAAGPPATPLGLGGDFAFDDLPDLPPEFEAGQPAEPTAMPTGVMGTLRQMALPEIVQSLEMGRKTASVDIVPADGEKGMIGFEGGSVRYCECGELLGEQAFFALMRHKEGYFRIHYGDAPPSMNIDAPTTFLLLEAMRLMDEEGIS